MERHKKLAQAKRLKNDEFYTRREDIELELCHYEHHFRGKVVYCNCDDPERSEFWKFFARHFRSWGLKKLVASCYVPDGRGRCFELTDAGLVTERTLWGTGDFRSNACVDLLRQADIVVTNPPFSLFREYITQLMEYGKKFLVIGNINAIAYKEFFPLLRSNRVWTGYKFNGNPMLFRVPPDFPLKAKIVTADGDGNPLVSVGGTCWFTNLDHAKRHAPLDLSGNRYYGNEDRYPRFDHYDAIEVSRTLDIPGDYPGVMGVPITFLDKYCPEQFDIVAFRAGPEGTPLVFTRDMEETFNRTFLLPDDPGGEAALSRMGRWQEVLRDRPEQSRVEPVEWFFPSLMPIGGCMNNPKDTAVNGTRRYARILIRRRTMDPAGETGGTQ